MLLNVYFQVSDAFNKEDALDMGLMSARKLSAHSATHGKFNKRVNMVRVFPFKSISWGSFHFLCRLGTPCAPPFKLDFDPLPSYRCPAFLFHCLQAAALQPGTHYA